MKIGVAILTLNASNMLARVLGPILQSPIVNKTVVFDSQSSDCTVSVAVSLGVEVQVIERGDFNHGATREFARQKIGTDIVVFLTQDVVPEVGFLEALVAPILAGQAAVAYARQLPHEGAGFFEAFPRHFNYPPESNCRSLRDAKQYGVYTFFCSDSCAAYLNCALDGIGGFRATLTNEDYFAAAALLREGHSICYVAESRVRHSHRYTLVEEFKRYFDIGYVRAENLWVNELVGAAEGRGASFFGAMVTELMTKRLALVPYAVVQTGIKWLGFRVGFYSLRAPTWWKRALSGQPYYWKSRYHQTNI